MTSDLKDSVALVCGATAGIGYAVACALLDAEVGKLMIVGRNPDRGEAARERLERRAPQAQVRFEAADLSHPEAATRVVERTVDAFGRIDTLVSLAAGDPMPRLLHETAIERIPQIIGSITSGILLPLRAARPQMMAQRSGSMICVASDAAKVATPGECAIGAAMAAVAMFCRTLALEARRSGIRVNCITPSIVQNTPLFEKVMADPFASRLFSKAVPRAALGVVEPEDLAQLVVFLAGPAAARLTGQTISVNGGISAA